MENTKQNQPEKNTNSRLQIFEWFFEDFNQDKRKLIFEIIYEYLFKEKGIEMENSPEKIEDYIKTKDKIYIIKKNNQIIELFNEKEKEINEKLEKYKIKLSIKNKYYLCLKHIEQETKFVDISCLRKIRFGDKYEWICSPLYLLYFQYYILKYKKPSSVKYIDEKNNDINEVETIDSIGKANKLLESEFYIYITDSNIQNIDLKQIFKDGNKNFIFTKENILKYLDYDSNDQKQIQDSDNICNNNYRAIIDFSYERHYDKIIYSFHNGYYFFEDNLMECLNNFQDLKCQFFYINFKKVKKIFNNKYLFKEYLGFWLAKLFPVLYTKDNNENVDNQSKCVDFINNLLNLISKNKNKYLETILEKINEQFESINDMDNYISNDKEIIKKEKNKDNDMDVENIDNNFDNKILVILNNIELSDIIFLDKKKFNNLNILLIFNLQDNYDDFQSFFYDETKLKLFFSEEMDEIVYKDPSKITNENNNYYSIFQTLNEYEKTKKTLIDEIFKDYVSNKDKLLDIALILNSYHIINKINKEKNNNANLRINFGYSSKFSLLKSFLPLINFNVSVNENYTSFSLDNVKFKEIIFYNYLKEIYLSTMVNYLNSNSNELFLDDIKGPLLEKDIILNILTGQIKSQKYKDFLNFKEIKVQSLYCLNYNNKIYEDNGKNNVVITQESKTAEFYDFAFKIHKNGKNHLKFAQASIFKDDNDLKRLNKESLILDIINFDLKKGGLNLGEINSYSFAIITSINVFNDYKDLDDDKKEVHTFFKMKEFCRENKFEFYIYDYFNNKIFIYNEKINNIEIYNDFFEEVNKIDLFDEKLDIYKYIKSSKKKCSLKSTKSNLLHPIENYYQANINTKINIINLAKYEFDSQMLNMFTGIDNIGIAFWNYTDRKEKKFNDLLINFKGKTEYFKKNKIIQKEQSIFTNPINKGVHTLLFLLSKEENKIKKKTQDFLKKKKKANQLYDGPLDKIE